MRTNHDVRDLKATARNSWRFLLVAILASVIGCDGDNIFGSDPKVVGSPEITELTLPESVESDKVLDLRVRAKSGRNIEQISLILREARDLDSIIAISPPRQEVVEDIAIRFPQAVRDTILVVRVTATDVVGGMSEAVEDTVRIIDATPPTVRLEVTNAPVGAGEEAEIRVEAEDNIGLREIGYLILTESGDTVTFELAQVAGSNHDSTFVFTVPDTLQLQSICVVGVATDIGGQLGVAADPVSLDVRDVTPPAVRFAQPQAGAAYAAGDRIRIEVEAEDAGGLASIQVVGQAFRGDPDIGTDVVVTRYTSQTINFASAPADTSLMRFLVPTDDRTPEVVYLIATAHDASGNQSTDTIQVNVGTPRVEILAPAGGAGLESGVDVEVRVRVEDPFDVEYLELVYSGIVEGTLTHDVSPAASSVEWEPTITLPADVSGELTIEIRARNALGITGTSGPRTYGVGDRTPPTVRIVEPEGGDQTRPIGDTITVEIEAADAGGLASVELMGVAYRPDPSLGPDIEVVRYQRQIIELEPMPTDTTVRRRLFPTNDDTAERVFFIATVRDKAGNVATDTVALSVGGPRVEILDPVPGTQVQSGGPFTVRISAEDDNNLSRIVLHYDGVVEGTQTFPVNPPSTSVLWEPEIVLPAGAEGTLELRAVAHSTAAIEPGRTGTVTVAVQTDAAPDDTPPFVGLTLDVPQRMEMTDSVRARVTAHDPNGSGVKQVGITVLALNGADTLSITRSIDFPIARRGMTVQNIAFAPFNVDPFALPDSVIFEVHAFAVDDAGNCAAAVEASDQQLACADYAGDIIADGVSGQRTDEILVVAGRTVLLPAGGTIADAVVDTVRQRLYLSNISRNSVEVLDLDANRFDFLGTPVGVGSQPWGLFLGGDGDTLIVANSGGTNISTVDLDLLTEERFRTPNIVLYQVRITVDVTTALESLSAEFIDFSDRPQFVAQDSVGRILYSTVPTGAAPDGTIRVATTDPTYDEPEVRLLFNTDAVTPADEAIVIANVDSVKVYQVTGSHDVIEIFDHVPGFPDNLIRSGRLRLFDAIEEMELRGSDIFHHAGTWIRDRIGMSDTTYVSASGDRGRIAFGEGATAPTGRIVLWNAEDASISNEVSVADLVGNASERVTGVDLNLNGSLGVARGRDAAYFFTNNLRLEGMFADGLQGGGVGAALHPYHDHPDADASGSGLAFVGTDRGSIAIIDSYFFRQVGEIQLRDRIIGPLRSSPPLPGDNAGRVCPGDPDCVVVKLYGITSAGGVVVVDVRRRDLDI